MFIIIDEFIFGTAEIYSEQRNVRRMQKDDPTFANKNIRNG